MLLYNDAYTEVGRIAQGTPLGSGLGIAAFNRRILNDGKAIGMYEVLNRLSYLHPPVLSSLVPPHYLQKFVFICESLRIKIGSSVKSVKTADLPTATYCVFTRSADERKIYS